ncbi:MAG TPA: hypothetical protein PKZ99_15500, partial [Azospirillaceae bacterium]|nr:hypothetical protein [Azospirillaceae bacterium]
RHVEIHGDGPYRAAPAEGAQPYERQLFSNRPNGGRMYKAKEKSTHDVFLVFVSQITRILFQPIGYSPPLGCQDSLSHTMEHCAN